MATNEEVEAVIADVYEKLIAAEAAHPDSPELTALHESLFVARAVANEHFGLGLGERSGGGPKNPPKEP